MHYVRQPCFVFFPRYPFLAWFWLAQHGPSLVSWLSRQQTPEFDRRDGTQRVHLLRGKKGKSAPAACCLLCAQRPFSRLNVRLIGTTNCCCGDIWKTVMDDVPARGGEVFSRPVRHCLAYMLPLLSYYCFCVMPLVVEKAREVRWPRKDSSPLIVLVGRSMSHPTPYGSWSFAIQA